MCCPSKWYCLYTSLTPSENRIGSTPCSRGYWGMSGLSLCGLLSCSFQLCWRFSWREILINSFLHQSVLASFIDYFSGNLSGQPALIQALAYHLFIKNDTGRQGAGGGSHRHEWLMRWRGSVTKTPGMLAVLISVPDANQDTRAFLFHSWEGIVQCLFLHWDRYLEVWYNGNYRFWNTGVKYAYIQILFCPLLPV